MAVDKVAITGVGVIAPGSTRFDAFREFLARGASAITEVTRFDTSQFAAHKAALLTDFTPKNFIPVAKLRRMNMLSRIGVSATKLCIDDVGETARRYARNEVGVAIGTAFGPVQTSLDYMNEYVEKGPALAPPQLFAESVANAPGSHVAIEYGFEGFNVTFTQRESSAMAALMHAATQIAKGAVRAAVVGGVEEMNEMTFSVLDRMRALAHATADTDEAARPFDRRRNGIIAGEGGCSFFLEAEPATRPYAWVSGFGFSRDPSATISDWGSEPGAVVRAMQRALDDAGITKDDVGAIFASANSSPRADRLEYLAIQELFGERVPPVVATKGYFGEYAAAGALQIAAAVAALDAQTLWPSTGFEAADDGMAFEPARAAVPAEVGHVLVNTISAGGGIICGVLSRGRG